MRSIFEKRGLRFCALLVALLALLLTMETALAETLDPLSPIDPGDPYEDTDWEEPEGGPASGGSSMNLDVTVTITGHSAVVTYDGQEHTVTGYDVEISNSMYTEADFEFKGDASHKSVSGTGAGTYYMGLEPSDFYNKTQNFNVKFEIVDGQLTINPITAAVTVTVTGHNSTVTYDGKEHSVSGYDWISDNELYKEDDFSYSDEAEASRTDAGTTDMGLTPDKFTNYSRNFTNVKFEVTDGRLYIEPLKGVVVTITGHHNTASYDGKEHSVSGYDVTNISNPLYTKDCFNFDGGAEASRTDAGTSNMGLNADQFTNTNSNFENVKFEVTDGYQKIEPIDEPVTVTIVGANATTTYDGKRHEVSGYRAKADNSLYNVKKDFLFTGSAIARRTDAGTSGMNMDESQFVNQNKNFENVTFLVTDGYQTIKPIDELVTVTIVGHCDSIPYDGKEHSVNGYDVEDISNPLYTIDDFTFNGSAYAARKVTGTTYMGLTDDKFTNTSKNFTSVTFRVSKDGYLEIKENPCFDGHDWNGWEKVDETNHKRTCKNCTASETEEHTGGTATCTEKAKCETCGAEYGDLKGHSWGNWTDKGDGTHIRTCDSCGTSETRYHSAFQVSDQWICAGPEGHYNRVCPHCNSIRNLTAHSLSATHNTGGATHSYSCSDCVYKTDPKPCTGEWVSDGNKTHTLTCTVCGGKCTLAHSGGTATCTEKAKCETCGQEYGSALGHSWDTKWSYDANGHYHKCLNDGCMARSDEAKHSGGTATCTEKAKCETCGQEYGSALGHSWDTKWSYDESGHYYKCLNEGCTAKKDKADHIYSNWTYVDGSTHKGQCICGAETTEKHAGGTATCTEPATCDKCNKPYGETKQHDWNDWEKVDETNHKRTCKNCTASETGEHTGGTATCTESATCTVCNKPYGETKQHDWNDWKKVDETNHKRTCKNCTASETGEHTGGTATCTEPATCTVCNQPYGSPLNHNWNGEWSYNDEGHYHKCLNDRCTARNDEAKHSGGTATCTKAAICDTCKQEYGSPKPDAHTPLDAVMENETTSTCTGTGSYDLVVYCDECGKELSRQTVEVSSAGHDYQLVGHSIIMLRYKCSRCGDSYWEFNKKSENELDGLIRDEIGEYLDYTAGVTYIDGERVLKVIPDVKGDAEIGLYLTPENVELWMKQGIGSVILATDAGELWVKLEDVSDIAFVSEIEPEYYVFSIVPGENGAAVKVEALTGEEKTAAETFEGVELK